MKRFESVLALVVFLLFCSTVWADVPRQINFQGILRQSNGNPVADGSYSVTFAIYPVPTGGTALWTENQSVTTSGLFTALLGSSTPLPDSIFKDTLRYLGIAVSPDGEMIPRQQLVSVGYSFAFAGWSIKDSNLILADRLGGSVGIGTDNPTERLDVAGNIRSSDTVFASAFSSLSPLKLQTNKTTRIYVDDVTGNVGIGTTSPGTKLEVSSPSNTYLRVSETGNSGANIQLLRNQTGGTFNGDWTLYIPASSKDLRFYDNTGAPGDRVTVQATTGNVGIGTTVPGDKLTVAGTGFPYVQARVSDDTDAGFHATGTSVGAETGGVEQWALFCRGTDNSGDFYIDEDYNSGVFAPIPRFVIKNQTGNVGIGTTSPTANLQVGDGTTPGSKTLRIDAATTSAGLLQIFKGGISKWEMYVPASSNDLRFYDGSDRITFQSGGNVGIGTTSPVRPLHLVRSANNDTSAVITIQNPDGGASAQSRLDIGPTTSTSGTRYGSFIYVNSADRVQLIGAAGATGGMLVGSSAATGPLALWAGNTEQMRIAPAGNVGIGTTSPQGALDVSSTTGAFIVPRMTTTQRNALTAVNGMIIYNTTDNQFNFYENGAWVTK